METSALIYFVCMGGAALFFGFLVVYGGYFLLGLIGAVLCSIFPSDSGRREKLLMKAQTGRTSTKYMSFEEKQAMREAQIREARFLNDRIDPEANVHPALRIN